MGGAVQWDDRSAFDGNVEGYDAKGPIEGGDCPRREVWKSIEGAGEGPGEGVGIAGPRFAEQENRKIYGVEQEQGQNRNAKEKDSSGKLGCGKKKRAATSFSVGFTLNLCPELWGWRAVSL